MKFRFLDLDLYSWERIEVLGSVLVSVLGGERFVHFGLVRDTVTLARYRHRSFEFQGMLDDLTYLVLESVFWAAHG